MSEVLEESYRKQSESSDSDVDIYYKPVVTLPEVEVKTNEEEEKVLLKIRAKIYRFDTEDDPPEWKERGTGELKLLQHKENHAVRIVMRRDKTFKVCANHFVTPFMDLNPHPSSEKAFVYTVPVDFAFETPRKECFAVKFATIDNANLFKTAFKEAQEALKANCDLYNGKCDEKESEDEDEEDVAKDFVKIDKVTDLEDKANDLSCKLAELGVKSDKEKNK